MNYAMSLGRRLREYRESKLDHDGTPWTRRKFVEEFNKVGKENLHEQTLYRYEIGKLRPPIDFLKTSAQILGIAENILLESRNLGRPLRIAIAPYPDFAFLSVAYRLPHVTGSRLYDPSVLPCEDVYSPYEGCIQRVMNGEVDVTLFNSHDLAVRLDRDPFLLDKIQVIGEVGYFSGFAVQTVDWGTGRIRSFPQILLEHAEVQLLKGVRPPSRQAVFEEALVQFFTQLEDFDVLVPANSLQFILLETLLKKSKRASPSNKAITSLEQALSRCQSEELSEVSAFNEFCTNLKSDKRTPCVYIGGLTQRLIAETLGASTAVPGECLSQICSVLDPQLLLLIHPSLLLVANRKSAEMGEDDLGRYMLLLTRAYDFMAEEDQDFLIVNALAEKVLRQSVASVQSQSVRADIETFWENSRGIFERIVRERLISFVPLRAVEMERILSKQPRGLRVH
jgi:transcriptional regulator with XRE-family HTH domain